MPVGLVNFGLILNFLINSSISLDLVLIDFVAMLLLAFLDAVEFVLVIVCKIVDLDFSSAEEAFSKLSPLPNPAPVKAPSLAPCLVACLALWS